MIAAAILRRRLRDGRTYEDFRKAWFHEEGFDAPNRMLTMLNIADPREVIVIGLTNVEPAEDGARLLTIDQRQRGASPLDEIIEPEIDRTFAIVVAEDDFSGPGVLRYHQAAVGGVRTDFAEIDEGIRLGRSLLATYIARRGTGEADRTWLLSGSE
jgi:hypothetical protein